MDEANLSENIQKENKMAASSLSLNYPPTRSQKSI